MPKRKYEYADEEQQKKIYQKNNSDTRKKKYHRVGIDFEHEYYNSTLLPAADKAGESVVGYVRKAVEQRLIRGN